MVNRFFSNLKLLTFYRGFLPVSKLVSEFLRIVIKKTSSSSLTVNLLITNRYNLLCKMCSWENTRVNSGARNSEELRIGEIKEFIYKVSKYQPFISIGGGEPFERSDLLDILRVIKDNVRR